MKAIETLEWKLNWWDRTKKKIVIAALVLAGASGTIGGTVAGCSYLFKDIKQETARKELVEDPVPELDVTSIRNECLDDVVIKGAYKKYEQIINGVSERTGVPKYVLAAAIEDGLETVEGLCASEYGWHGFVKITEKEAGVKESTLWKDPEQCLLTVAGKYKKILDNVKDEETALGMLFTDEDQVKSAKKRARIFMGIIFGYERWRNERKPDVLKLYDPLTEKIDNEKDPAKREELVKEIMQVWDSCFGTHPGLMENESVYRVLTARKYHKRGQWWPEQLMNSGVKVALRLKRDGYN